MRHIIYIILFYCFPIALVAQVNCPVRNFSFQGGETVTYRAVYNWGFIWLNAGDVRFEVKDTLYNGVPAYLLESTGWSLKEYDWFFKVRDRFSSIVGRDNLRPFWFERDTYEGGFKTYNRYDFNHSRAQLDIFSFTSYRKPKRDTLKLKPCTFDVLSAIYYCRNIDFDHYQVGQRIPLTMAIDNEVFDLYLRYLGREVLTTRDGSRYKTIKFSAMLVAGTIFKGGEDLYVWVTDDLNRIPILVEAKILVGSVKAVFSGIQGQRNPIDALVGRAGK